MLAVIVVIAVAYFLISQNEVVAPSVTDVMAAEGVDENVNEKKLTQQHQLVKQP